MSLPKQTRTLLSLFTVAAAAALANVPLPGLSQTIVIVSGSELEESLTALEERFEQQNPNINVDVRIQGSQDIINNYIDRKNDFTPTVLIPANEQTLTQLSDRLKAQGETEIFWDEPQPVAKTMLVGVAWPERGKVLFPNGQFQWSRLESAMRSGRWAQIGGPDNWGSFDFVTTDPTRSNSGQLTLGLWTQSSSGSSSLGPNSFATSEATDLFALAKRSIYLPPRSTDILLQEFIARGPNDADAATVYESIALHRWEEAAATQSKSYQIYYLSPTMETVSTAAIARRDINGGQAAAARKFIAFLIEPEQQQLFVQFGFRPTVGDIDLASVPGSPWAQNIPGAEIDPPVQAVPLPNPQVVAEIQRLWKRVQ